MNMIRSRRYLTAPVRSPESDADVLLLLLFPEHY
jgi:hypothetical protein